MPGPLMVRNFQDSYVSQLKPKKNYNSLNRLKLADNGGTPSDQRYGFLYFSRPFPLSTNILTSKLRIWNDKAETGSITVTIKAVTQPWSASKVDYNSRPNTTATNSVSVTKTAPAAGTMWEFNIVSMLQAVANGAAWYGIRLEVNGTSTRSFHSAQSGTQGKRPELEISWTDAPEPPETLNPDGGVVSLAKPVLTFDFTDVAGDTTLSAFQVQANINGTDDFTTPGFDSGWVTPTDGLPMLDLNTTAFAGVPAGGWCYWRVRVRDGGGATSAYSDVALFGRTLKGTLTLASPAVSPNNYVEDTSPTITWALTSLPAGVTQEAFQIWIVDANNPAVPLYNSGKVSGTANSHQVKSRTLKSSTMLYGVGLRVWDTADREQTFGDPIFYEVYREFTYQGNGTVTAPVIVSATPNLPWPYVDIVFTRASAPDSFSVWRDGDLVQDDIDPADIWVSGTTYSYQDRLVSPRQQHTWTVTAKQNSIDSNRPTGQSATPSPPITWMMRPDGTDPICIVKAGERPAPVVDASTGNMQEVHQPVGGGAPVLVTQFIRGFEGHVSGILSDDIVSGLSARTMRDRFKLFKKQPGIELLLYMVDEALTIVPYNLTYRPRAKGGKKVIYDIEFDFFEV
jgi:hypothetical protein